MEGSGVDPEWKEVATVSKLYVHPVKSCRGISVESFTSCEQGVMYTGSEIGDRTFMVVYEKGRFATIRQFPKLVLIRPTVVGTDSMKLEAPGMNAIEFRVPKYEDGCTVGNYKVFGDVCPGLDCGDEIAAWLKKYLGNDAARLVFHNKELPKNVRTTLQKFPHLNVYSDKPIHSVFQDYSPFNMCSEASLSVLNSKLEKKVTERSFRPNVFLTDCDAFAEDNWRHIRIGSAEFIFAKFCTRCQVTTVDPETGVKSPEALPLEKLREFRKCLDEERAVYGNAPKFSVDFVNIREGIISVGDKVYLNLNAK